MKKLLVNIVQFLFGVVFIVGGVMKCIDPAGTAIKIKDYMLHFGVFDIMMDTTGDVTIGLACALSLLELSIGIAIVYGYSLKRFLTYATLLMLFFTPLTLYLAVTDAIPDCGCFGDAIKLSNWHTFIKNVWLDAGLVIMWGNLQRLYQLTGKTRYTIIFYLMCGVGLVLMGYALFRLPVVDFRPYKPGVSLRYEENQDAPEFFVRDSESGEDMTTDILADSSYTYLIIAPQLATASEHDLDKLEALAEWTQQEWYGFYMLTGPDQQQIDDWRYRTGAQYPILVSDTEVLQTMVRANPGVMVLHDGKILWKSSEFDMERLQNGLKVEEIDYKMRLFYILILFFAPICLSLLRIFAKKILSLLFRKGSDKEHEEESVKAEK